MKKIVFASLVLLFLITPANAVTFHDGKIRMRECTIDIDYTKVSGSANISNYLLRLYRANIPNEVLSPTNNNHAQKDGGDIAFSQGGTEIACYVYRWEYDSSDAAADASILVFVEIPTLYYQQNTTIKMHWKASTKAMQARYDQTYGAKDCFSTYAAFWPFVPTEPGHHQYVGLDASFNNLNSSNILVNNLVSDDNILSDEYAAWPSITELTDGTLLCLYRENGIHDFDLDGNLYIRQSTDSGVTWTDHSSIIDANYDLRGPSICELKNGRLMMIYGTSTLAPLTSLIFIRFWDNNAWGDAIAISDGTVKVNRGKPLYMSNGEVLCPLYGIYTGANGDVWACIYNLNTETYADYSVVTDSNFNEWSAVESPTTPGTLYGFFRNNADYDIYKSTSTDFGHTWGALSKVIETSTNNATPAEPNYNQYGDLLVAYSADRVGTDAYEYIVRSTDNGSTFVDSAILDIGHLFTGTGGYESFVVRRNELISVWYEDNSVTGYANIYCSVGNQAGGLLTSYLPTITTTLAVAPTFADGINFNGSSEYFKVGTTSSFNFFHTTGIFTISGWIRMDDYTIANNKCILASTPKASADKGVWLAKYDTNDTLNLCIAKGGSFIIDSYTGSDAIHDNNFHYVVVSGNATNVFFDIDSVRQTGSGTMATKTTGNATRELYIAQSSANLGWWDGNIKMLSMRSSCITEGLADTEYNNENAPSTFAIEGAPTSGGFKPQIISY